MASPVDDKPSAPNLPPRGVAPRASVASPKAPSKPAARLLVGSVLSDRYRIERLLGEGGMGAVYQAEHVLMRKRMAIKVLHAEMTRLPEVVARFEREAMAAAHIDHPHVATATDFGKLDNGSFFLALEFIEGRSLREALAPGALELGRALHITKQIATALARAHSLKIVHRDLKPENIMLVDKAGDPDFVKVLDFGIAKVQIGELTAGDVSASAPGQPVLTQAGMVYGTPEYMAPEQALGQSVDARADLYALGCMLFEMLSGVRPFDAESKVALLGMHVTSPIPSLASKAPGIQIPPDVEALVRCLLAKEAAERLGDARELIDQLTVLLAKLAAEGRIDARYAPPLSNTTVLAGSLGTLAIHLAAASATTERAKPPAPELALQAPVTEPLPTAPPRSNPAWIIAATLGLLGIFSLVITVLLLHRREAPPHSPEPAVSYENALVPAEQRIKDAIAQIDKGNYGAAIEALEALEALEPPTRDREDVHRALFKAYAQTDRPAHAMRAVSRLVQARPNLDWRSPENIALRQEVRNTALFDGHEGTNPEAVAEAWRLLEGPLGTVGFDDLYDIAWGRSGLDPGYKRAKERAKRDIAAADRSKMSQALAVTVDLHAVVSGTCAPIKALLERAEDAGDERTLALLKTLTAPRIVRGEGFRRAHNALQCIHDGSLTKTIAAIEERIRKK
jgi:serine/threonine protein kinase